MFAGLEGRQVDECVVRQLEMTLAAGEDLKRRIEKTRRLHQELGRLKRQDHIFLRCYQIRLYDPSSWR